MSTMSTIEDAATPLDLSSIPYLELYYSIPMRLVASLICAINLGVGFIGNLLVILVVLTAKARMLTPTNCYLVSLSAADLIVLVVGSVSLITEMNSVRDHWILGGLVGCQMTVYLTYVGVNTSAFSITAFSVERYIAICHPISAQTACTVKRAKRIIFGVWLFGLVYNSPWIYLAMIKQKSMFNGSLVLPACGHRYNRSNGAYMSLYLGDLVLFYLIPLVLLTIMYSLIARILFGTDRPARPQVVKMLLVVVVLFALLWLPYRFLVAYNSIAPAGYRISSEWYVIISRLLVYSNSAVNPVIYNA
uniref:Thyrotropin-releasing hormone receptor n=1 Tax=Macrostomum lignano TaxID=282301 RepID=A0A1I8G208_9PLAT